MSLAVRVKSDLRTPVVIDNGSSSIKIGFAGEKEPRITVATVATSAIEEGAAQDTFQDRFIG